MKLLLGIVEWLAGLRQSPGEPGEPQLQRTELDHRLDVELEALKAHGSELDRRTRLIVEESFRERDALARMRKRWI
jgi:hypothetical protein